MIIFRYLYLLFILIFTGEVKHHNHVMAAIIKGDGVISQTAYKNDIKKTVWSSRSTQISGLSHKFEYYIHLQMVNSILLMFWIKWNKHFWRNSVQLLILTGGFGSYIHSCLSSMNWFLWEIICQYKSKTIITNYWLVLIKRRCIYFQINW